MTNKVFHFEIAVKNLQKSTAFYTKMFDWKIKANYSIGYNTVATGEGARITGALVEEQENDSERYVTIYIKTDDIKELVSKFINAGGSVRMEITKLANTGKIALVRDPDRNVIGLFEPAKRE